jgi:hypothetical protein
MTADSGLYVSDFGRFSGGLAHLRRLHAYARLFPRR